jgi:hypothetical protein
MDTVALILYLALILFIGAGGGRFVVLAVRRLARVLAGWTRRCAQLTSPPA